MKSSGLFVLLAVVLSAVFSAGPTWAGEFDLRDGAIIYSGAIDIDDSEKLAEVAGKTKPGARVVINTKTGNFVGAIAVGTKVRLLGLETASNLNTCNGLCALIWLAGNVRHLGEPGNVRFEVSPIWRMNSARTVELAYYLAKIDASLETIKTLTGTDESGLHDDETALSPDDLNISYSRVGTTVATAPDFGSEATYDGSFKGERPHGKGTLRFAEGDVYKGGFKFGFAHGKGVLITAEGDRFDGNFKYGIPDGYGILTTAEGDRYEGWWARGLERRHVRIQRSLSYDDNRETLGLGE